MNKINFNTGDTNFLCLVNNDQYASFINDNWDLEKDIIPHIAKQQKLGNILMYQMSQEGLEDDWEIRYYFEKETPQEYIRRSQNYIKVTNNKLYVIDYTCLTMAAQFPDELIPNKECEPYCIELENGHYRINAYLYKNVDTDEKIGHEEDLAFYFEKISMDESPGIIWGAF